MFSVKNLQLGRGITTACAQGKDTSVIHSYIDTQTTVANIKLYLPPFLNQGEQQDVLLLTDYMFITGSDTAILARITSLDPFTVDVDLFSGAAGLSVGAPIAPVDNNGARIAVGILQLEFADQTHNGIISTGSQHFSGDKTFHADINIVDPPNGLILQKTLGSFGVELVTSDPTAQPGVVMTDTALPGEFFGMVYRRTGFISANPELYVLGGNQAGIVFNDTDGTVTIGDNTITNNLDARAGQILHIGQTNATAVTVHKQLNITAGNDLLVDEIDVFTPGTLKVGATNTTDVFFPKPVSFATPGGIPAQLNGYEEYTHSTTFTNNTETTATVNLFIVRIGSLITFRIPADFSVPGQVAPVTSFSADTLLPARFRPASTCNGHCRVSNNGIFSSGAIEVTSAGAINIYNNVDFTTAFTAAVTNGFSASTFAYTN